MYERTYNAKVLSQKAPPEKKRRRRFPWRKFMIGLVSVLILAAIVILIRLPQLQVKTIAVVGTEVTDPEDVSIFIRSQIEGNFLYAFPKTSMLLVPTTSVAKWTAKEFPRFSSVDVRRKGVHGLTVSVSEHQGTYLWCAMDECYFMNADGLVFAPAPFFSGDAYAKLYIGTKSALPFSPLTPEQFAMVQVVLSRLPSIGINPSAIRDISSHQIDIDFSHKGTMARLMIDPNNDIEQTLEHLATALETDPLKTSFRSNSSVLEYLDARFSNRIVYKFR
jgi:cell division septal protein FtsQ